MNSNMTDISIIKLFDGKYYNETRIYDDMTIAIEGSMIPTQYAEFENKIMAKYRFNNRINIGKESKIILEEMGLTVIQVFPRVIDYSRNLDGD